MVEINKILRVATAIYAQIKKVKSNKAQLALLGERIKTVEQVICKIDHLADSAQLTGPLQRLHDCLQCALSFLQQLADHKWFDLRYVLYANKYRSKLAQIQQHLRDCIQDLDLGLDIHLFINHWQNMPGQAINSTVAWESLEAIIAANQQTFSLMTLLSANGAVHRQALTQKHCALKKQVTMSKLVIEHLIKAICQSNQRALRVFGKAV